MQYLENGWIDFHEIWYGHYAVGDYSKFKIFNLIQSVIPMCWMLKLMRWDQDDAIDHDPLCMHDDVIALLQQ
jgi:hypothetical protein